MALTRADRQAVYLDVHDDGTASIIGAPVFNGGMPELLDALDVLARSGEPHLVVTPNVDQVLSLEESAPWREQFRGAALRIADGAPIVALARALGASSVRRLTGSDLIVAADAAAAARGWRIAVIGGSDAALDRIEERDDMRVFRLPALSGIDDPASEPAIAALTAYAPTIVFICLGSPKQELWFAHWRDRLPAAAYVGAGAAADFLAGRLRRAPRGVQRLGLEWAWRLAHEPRRLAHRYLVKGPRFAVVAARSVRGRGGSLDRTLSDAGMSLRDSTVFVNWYHHQGRSESLSAILGIDCHFYSSPTGTPLLRQYAHQWRRTVRLLRRTRPTQVIVMQPPVIALLAVRLATLGRGVRVVADLHTGAFLDRKWAWSLPLVLRLVGRRGLSIVTNEELAERVRRRGGHALVLHDPIEPIEARHPATGSYVLLPFAFASDEPLREVLEAARLDPSIEWRISGPAPEWLQRTTTPNVRVLGFLPEDDYWREFEEAGVIGALTTKDFTMQRAGYEALSRTRPLLITDTVVLREYFGDSVAYTRPLAADLARDARRALDERTELAERMRRLRDEKLATQDAGIASLRAWLTERTAIGA